VRHRVAGPAGTAVLGDGGHRCVRIGLSRLLPPRRSVRTSAWRGSGRDREAVYAVAADTLAVAARRLSRRDLTEAERAAGAMLRLTARELCAAVRAAEPPHRGAPREMVAMRGKVRLAPAGLRRVNALLDELQELLRAGGSPGQKLFALTIVLTPARDGAAPPPRRR
jgi:hypothetical protein